MAYDPVRDRVVFFGGASWGCENFGTCSMWGDTWEWDGTSWVEVATSGPAPRAAAGMAYSAAAGGVVLFGGMSDTFYTPDSFFDDTWVWDGASWQELTGAGGPSRRVVYDAMETDPVSTDIVLFGGLGDEVEDIPGGAEVHGDTWTFDGSSWTGASSGGLTPRYGVATAQLPDGVLLYGGYSPLFDETWVWRNGAWSMVESGYPPGRYVAMATWDTVRQEVLLFGGQTATEFATADMFSWQDPAWSTYTFSAGDHFGHRKMAGLAEDPVNTGSGNFTHIENDLGFPGEVFGMDWTLAYNSADTSVGPLGQGWTFGHAAAVVGEDAEGNVTVRTSEGREVEFVPDGAGGYLRPDELYGELVAEADGSFRLDFFDGVVWDFDAQGRLGSLSNWDGQSVTITYGTDGPTDISSSTGYSLTVAYDTSGRISTVSSSDGRAISYTYDAAGLLASATDPEGGVTTYRYDAGGGLDRITDPEGVVILENLYDPNARVVRQLLPSDGGHQAAASFAYNIVTRETVVLTFGAVATEITIYRHDEEGRLEGITDTFGNDVALTRQSDGELTGATSRLGETLTQSFDVNGNLLSSATTVGGSSSYAYDGLDRLTSLTDPSGATTTFGYEGTERIPSTVTDETGEVTALVVTGGLVQSVTDQDGITTTFTYNSQRRLVSETDDASNTTTYGHDAAGRVTSITSPLGNVTSFTYDSEGRLLTSTDPTGGITGYTYDSAGRVASVTDPGGAVTNYSYDPAGRLVSTTDARGAVTSYQYNTLGDLISTIRPGDAVTFNDIQELGRLLSVWDPMDRKTSYGYDADGNQTSITDPLGNVTVTQRDVGGRVTSVTDPLGRTTTNAYDPAGRLTSVTDPEGGVTSYTYDNLGRVETVTDPRGGVTTTTYTAAGRIATVMDPNGLTTSYAYDSAGRITTVTDPEGGVTSYGYDADGNQTTVTRPDGLTTATTYDAAGRSLVTTGPDGISVTRTYDARGDLDTIQRAGDSVVDYNHDDRDLLDVADALGNTATFGYDDRGNRTSITDALSRTSTTSFNDADQITAVTDALGRTTTTSYDGAGRVETVSDPSGRTVTIEYDAAGQLISQTFADGTTISYGYDDAGRRTTTTDPTGTTSYEYDPAGNLTSVTHPPGDILSYSYDPAGRVSQVTYPDGATVTYTYNNTAQILSAAHSTGGTAAYTYDPDGRLISESLPDGTTRSYTYTDGRLTSYTQNATTTNLTYDTSGRIASTSGGEDWTFGYDQAGQLTTATQGTGDYTYSYDSVGNITTITDPEISQTFTVDAANQLTTGSDGSAYQHDPAGRLIQAAEADGSIHFYSYNSRGLLERETILDTCEGLTPTITGTEGADNLTGTSGDDIIFGLGGNDTINGGRGNDIVCGGSGDDTINGDNGDDILIGGTGIDTIDGGGGGDLISGGGDADNLSGGGGNDQIHGGPSNDTLNGNQNNDTLDGGPGTDSLDGGSGSDSCETEPGAVSCENPLPNPLPVPAATAIDRTYDGDGLLTEVTITHPDETTDVYSLLWDRSQPVPQIVSLTHNGTTSQIIYGPNRAFAVQGGSATGFEYSILGDATGGSNTVATSFDPYGSANTQNLTVGFGYRGELHVGDLVYLRNRDLNPNLGRFTTTDPLDGIPGTTTVANQYHYANNNPVSFGDPTGLRATDRDLKKPARQLPVETITTPSPSTSALCLLPSAINWCDLRRGPSMWDLEPWIEASADRYVVDPFVVAAIIFHEGGAVRTGGDLFRHFENVTAAFDSVGVGQIFPATAQEVLSTRFGVDLDLADLRRQLIFNDQFSIDITAQIVKRDSGLLGPTYADAPFLFTTYANTQDSIRALAETDWNLEAAKLISRRLDITETRHRLQILFPRAWDSVMLMWEFGGFLGRRSPGDFEYRTRV